VQGEPLAAIWPAQGRMVEAIMRSMLTLHRITGIGSSGAVRLCAS